MMIRKRPLPETQVHHQCCSLCQNSPVVLIEYSKKKTNDYRQREIRRKNQQNLKAAPNQALCLLHFYTTDACRKVSIGTNSELKEQHTTATIIGPNELQQQIPAQQELFAEAYLQIQQQIQDAMRQQQQEELSANHDDDPLAIITDLNKGFNNIPRANQGYDRLKSLLPRVKKVKPHNPFPEGGFLRHVPTPERIIQVQQQQVQQQQELIARMNQSSASNSTNQNDVDPESIRIATNDKSKTSSHSTKTTDVTQRRKPSRANVWTVISQEDRKQAATTMTVRPTTESTDNEVVVPQYDTSVVCTCGSTATVEVLSSNTNKSQDMTKAETWGNKDRHDEIINRYLCHHCGKSWNDVE